MKAILTAFRTLTILRLPGRDSPNPADAFYAFPFVGLFMGVMVGACGWLMSAGAGWHTGAGAAGVVVSSVVTGGLHLDGLADAFDALGGRTVERRLEIMKDTHAGSFGIAAMIAVLIVKFAAITRLSETGSFLLMVVPYIVSRMAQVQLAVSLPYARNEGGTGRAYVEGAGRRHFAVAAALGIALAFLVGGNKGLLAAFAVLPAIFLSGLWLKRKFGGVTGDLIGMCSELTECGVLAALAIAAG